MDFKEEIEKEYLFLQDLYSDSTRKSWPAEVAQQILQKEKILTLSESKEVYSYNPQNGLYEQGDWKIKYITQFVRGKLASAHFTNEVMEIIKTRTTRQTQDVQPNLELIPLENCVYNFKTKETKPYNPDLVFFVKHPIVYTKPNFEENPLLQFENPIDKFLYEIVEKQEEVLFLKEFIGYCFYRAMPVHMVVILVGAGSNGKSVFLGLIERMLGKNNISNRTLQELADDRFASSNLYLKNANIVGDLPAKALKDTGLIKRISGEDTIPAQRKFKEPFEFKPYSKIVCAANEVPETPDLSIGFFRRMFVINFPNSFEGKENRNLLNELSTPANLSIFFLSCIDAFSMALQDNYFILKDTVEMKREKYFNYSNSAAAFCNQMLEYDPESELSTNDIWEAYLLFCKEKKLIQKDNSHFFISLYKFFSNRVFKRRKSILANSKETRYYVICGIDWKEVT